MRKLKIFGPHWELRVFVTEQMEEDYKSCHKKLIDSDFEADTDCEHCSWKDTNLPCEWGSRMCELYEVEQKLMEVPSEED